MKCPSCGAGIVIKEGNTKLVTTKVSGGEDSAWPLRQISFGTVSYINSFEGVKAVPTTVKKEMSVKCEHCGTWHLLSEVRTAKEEE